MSRRAFIGMGGNVGDVAATFRQVLADFDGLPQTRLVRQSPVYRTAPVGGVEQPDFLNAVAELETALAPLPLLHRLWAIERRYGRDRQRETRWGPRTLDLDILLLGDVRMQSEQLTLPHPRMHERLFVLRPLADIAADLEVPGQGTVRQLLAQLG